MFGEESLKIVSLAPTKNTFLIISTSVDHLFLHLLVNVNKDTIPLISQKILNHI